MCSAFCGVARLTSQPKPKIAWPEVCKLKQEGGLGVRSIREVSTIFALKLIWCIFENADSLWVLWVKRMLLCGSSFWDVREGVSGSWVWRKLLQLRHIAKKFVRMVINDGRTVQFLTDIWHPIGRLIGEHGTQKLGIVRNAIVSTVLVNNEWQFQNKRDRAIQPVIAQIKEMRLVLAEGVKDTSRWMKEEGTYEAGFSTSATWKIIRVKHDMVPWHRIIWFAQGVPRYALSLGLLSRTCFLQELKCVHGE